MKSYSRVLGVTGVCSSHCDGAALQVLSGAARRVEALAKHVACATLLVGRYSVRAAATRDVVRHGGAERAQRVHRTNNALQRYVRIAVAAAEQHVLGRQRELGGVGHREIDDVTFVLGVAAGGRLGLPHVDAILIDQVHVARALVAAIRLKLAAQSAAVRNHAAEARRKASDVLQRQTRALREAEQERALVRNAAAAQLAQAPVQRPQRVVEVRRVRLVALVVRPGVPAQIVSHGRNYHAGKSGQTGQKSLRFHHHGIGGCVARMEAHNSAVSMG
mmetsp:Transcript_54298/g.133095  ORF Transcript_54298/g.133095 Transcript_54298/m.133095 type:complete len:275 (-) Transcript_54298:555-1379(-)